MSITPVLASGRRLQAALRLIGRRLSQVVGSKINGEITLIPDSNNQANVAATNAQGAAFSGNFQARVTSGDINLQVGGASVTVDTVQQTTTTATVPAE